MHFNFLYLFILTVGYTGNEYYASKRTPTANIMNIVCKEKRSHATVKYYSNSTASFMVFIQLQYDIELNHGPVSQGNPRSWNPQVDHRPPTLKVFYQNARNLKINHYDVDVACFSNDFDIWQ